MMQIAGALQTEPSFFFEGSPSSDAADAPSAPRSGNGKRTPDDPLDSFMANRTAIELARAFMKIKKFSRRALLVRIAEEFASE